MLSACVVSKTLMCQNRLKQPDSFFFPNGVAAICFRNIKCVLSSNLENSLDILGISIKKVGGSYFQNTYSSWCKEIKRIREQTLNVSRCNIQIGVGSTFQALTQEHWYYIFCAYDMLIGVFSNTEIFIKWQDVWDFDKCGSMSFILLWCELH